MKLNVIRFNDDRILLRKEWKLWLPFSIPLLRMLVLLIWSIFKDICEVRPWLIGWWWLNILSSVHKWLSSIEFISEHRFHDLRPLKLFISSWQRSRLAIIMFIKHWFKLHTLLLTSRKRPCRIICGPSTIDRHSLPLILSPSRFVPALYKVLYPLIMIMIGHGRIYIIIIEGLIELILG